MSHTMGRNVGPLFMRTYGKSKGVRKVDAWLTPDYRKKAFSSTDGSDPSLLDANDSSVQLKKRKKKGRPAKKKATANLKEVDSDVENVFLPEPVPKTNKVTSQRKPPRQPMKKGRGRVLLSSMSENEQPIAAMRRGQKKSARIFSTSESEEDSLMKNPRVTSVLQKKNSRTKTLDSSENSAAPEPGKFVTARRRVQSVKPRGPSSKPLVLCPSVTLDSSDDFARAVPALPRAVTRRKRLPLRPPVGLERTSSDVSMGPPPGAARAPLPRSLLRESLNASADDPSLACHAPLFSSTPSAALGRRLPQRLQDPSLSGIHFSTEDSATDTEPAAGHRPQQKRPRRGPTAHSRLRDTATASRSPLAATRNDRSKLVIMCRRVAECHHEAAVSGTNGQPAPPAPAEQTGPVNVELAGHSVVEVEEMEVAASPAAAPSPTEPPSQLADSPSGAQGTGVEPGQEDQLASLVLFSRVEEQEEEEDEEQAASGFVTAETRLDSLVEALKERCRTASPVVRLPRTDLSLLPPLLSLDTSSRILSAGETFSSCLDSQPADRVSTRRGSGPVFELSSCAELPSICATVPPAPSAITPTRRAEDMEEPREEEEEEMEEEEEEEEMEEEEQEAEEEEGEDKEEEEKETAQVVGEVDEGESCVGEGGEASGLGELTDRLKARCVSCQPVILLDSLRLSPFLLRHHGATVASSSSAPGAPVPAVKTAPASKSCSSDSIALPAPTTPSFSNSSAGLHSDAAAGKGQPERHRLNKRRLSNSFPTAGGGSGGASGSGSSPEQTVLANRSKLPAGRVGTGRKACVSGLSANRWTKRDTNLARAQHNAHDSLDFGPASVAKPSKELLSNWSALPVTPARAEQLNISSILAGLSPDASLSTHMWSRLKAALSVHKKKTAFATPRRLGLSSMQSPAVQRLNASQDIFASPSLASLTRLSRYSHSSQLSVAEDISDAEKVFQECQQEGPQTFDQCIPPARMKLCRKIGEGTFGEVFSTTNNDGQPVALKIIPVEGKQKVNGEDQKSFGEILHEIIISKELSSLDEKEENRTGGFIGLHDLHCAQGSYPKQLLSAWDKFDKKRGSENDRPDFFGEEQFFLILEFEFGGSDLENMNGKLSSLAQAKSILQQVTAALAVAEQALCFEHRDLHWGNVLVKTTKQKECDYVLSGQTCSLETRGVQVNIIDYSLSRLEIDGLTVSCDISADEELFMGQGDYQFDIYRKMREENRNNWSEYHPHTNVLWLHYLTDKLLGMKYKSSAQGAQARALKSSLRAFHQDLPAFQSAADVLQRSSLFP